VQTGSGAVALRREQFSGTAGGFIGGLIVEPLGLAAIEQRKKAY
jgi:hypothetical protein